MGLDLCGFLTPLFLPWSLPPTPSFRLAAWEKGKTERELTTEGRGRNLLKAFRFTARLSPALPTSSAMCLREGLSMACPGYLCSVGIWTCGPLPGKAFLLSSHRNYYVGFLFGVIVTATPVNYFCLFFL